MFDVCEDKFEFKNQRRKPTPFSAPFLVSDRVKFAFSRALLTVYNYCDY